MSKFLNGIKSFVHSISTSDHYASYDPSRPQGQEDTAPLATTHDLRRSSSSSLGKSYVPGMRSAQLSGSSTNIMRTDDDSEQAAPHASSSGRDSIPLSDMTPIPSASLSWNRIDTWIEQNYPELFDQLLEGATNNDLNDLEHDLDCALPQDVRESYSVHDGQEPGAKPTGVFFGIALLDLEGISEEWNVWRRAALKIDELAHRNRPAPSAGSSSTSSSAHRSVNSKFSWIEQQKSFPPDAVQPVYAHPGWIPLAKDFDGNNIAVDLAPGPKGRYGQVILFGRDFDTKFVVAPSWGDFLAQFAADLESGQCFIDEDIENAVFAFKVNGMLVSYFNVLRRRVERTHPKPQTAPQQQQQPQQQSQRRSMGNIASVSHNPVNSGRVTPRLISPTSSSTSLPLSKDGKSKQQRWPQSLAGQLNEVDLNKKDTEAAEQAAVAPPPASAESKPADTKFEDTDTSSTKTNKSKNASESLKEISLDEPTSKVETTTEEPAAPSTTSNAEPSEETDKEAKNADKEAEEKSQNVHEKAESEGDAEEDAGDEELESTAAGGAATTNEAPANRASKKNNKKKNNKKN